MIDAVQLLLGEKGGVIISIGGVLFLATLFGNMVSWSAGVNSIVAYAAQKGDMPQVFAKERKANQMPVGAAMMNGIVASVVVIIAPFIPNQDLFWCFFALNLVMFLMAYLPIFPAFLKLRTMDASKERPFKVPGSRAVLTVLAILPMLLIMISLIFVAIPLQFDQETLASVLPITIGSIICIIIGELIARKQR